VKGWWIGRKRRPRNGVAEAGAGTGER